MSPVPDRNLSPETGGSPPPPPDAPLAPGPVKTPAVPALPAARVPRLARFLIRALRGRAMPLALKISLGGGPLVYFFLPNDFIPDATPRTGRLDDMAVLAAACALALACDPEARRLACARLRAWLNANIPAETGQRREQADAAANGPPSDDSVDKTRRCPDK